MGLSRVLRPETGSLDEDMDSDGEIDSVDPWISVGPLGEMFL